MNKKIILVTGGSSGIGLGTIEYLLEQNNYEIISVSRSDKNIKLAKEKLGINSNKVTFLKGDVSNKLDCIRIYNEINNLYGRLDGLVNAAGIIKIGGFEELSLDDWNNIININLTGIFLLKKILLPLIKKGKNPSIVNISSLSAEKISKSIGYSVSKAGVDILTKTMAKELAKYNIRVNMIKPGTIYTNIYIASGDYTKEEYDRVSLEKKKTVPLGRIGDAKKDIAPTIEFLLSEKSSWTTGASYVIDGGRSLV